tara:strand:- start:782 stop:2221 length:1440 start_codon:yes stop_codon:yes gene_type:complete
MTDVADNIKGDKVHEQDGQLESDFFRSARLAKDKLDTISPSMCLAKWSQVSLHLPTGLNNSCYHPPLHKIDAEEVARDPAALHNTAIKKQQRKMMVDGQRPSECSYCWNIEDTGNYSDRHYRSGEPWAMMDFDKIKEGGWEANINPRYVEVNFNHACNFACTYCSPQFSTTWGQEIDKHGAYPTIKEHNAPEHFKGRNRPVPAREVNPYVDAFWKWWPDMYKDLKHFRMTGGEPMMDKNTYKVFDWVLANPKPDLHLNVTSNFCPPNEKLWDKYLDYVKRICAEENVEHFMNFVSVDSWGSQAEYLRRGLDFDRMWHHVDQFLTEIPGRNSITFIITYNNLSIVGIKKLLQGILELRKKHSKDYQRIWFDTPLLREPDWQNIQILPESYQMLHEDTIEWMKQNIETRDNRLHCIKDFEIQRMERDLAYMRKRSVDVDRKRADFWKFFKEYDKRHNHDIRQIFPEMQQFFDVCESEASKW